MALNPLQPSEIEAWARLMDIRLLPWEVAALFRMDAAMLARLNAPKKEKDSKKIDARDTQAVNAQMSRLAASGSRNKRNGSHKRTGDK